LEERFLRWRVSSLPPPEGPEVGAFVISGKAAAAAKQEQIMNQQAISLIDVLMPPGNRWLMELSRRKADLPPGVRIVRFSDNDNDDEPGEADELGATSQARRRKVAVGA
jgi:hypothetical protein